MNKEKLYLIIIIIFLIIFSAGIVFYAHIQNAGLTKTILSRVASFGPLWILDSNEGSGGINKFVKIKSSKDNLPKELFGVTILDNPEKYLHENSQGKENDYGGRLKHTWYRAKDIKNLITDTFFDKYATKNGNPSSNAFYFCSKCFHFCLKTYQSQMQLQVLALPFLHSHQAHPEAP